MKHLFLGPLLVLPLFFAPVVVVFGADAKPKAAKNDQPEGGDKAQPQPAAGDDQAEPKADADSDQADTEKPKPRKTGSRPTSMGITSERAGLKTLTIHFRWALYPNASVEVRLVPGPVPKGATVAPIYFSEFLQGKVQEQLFNCLDHPGEGGRSYSFTKDKIVYNMIGRRNSLGNQGVHVHVHSEESDKHSPPKPLPPGAHVQPRPRLEEADNQEANPAAAYLQLDTWAVDKETLSLDLAQDEFAKPGTLFVWFFRGDQPVWQEQIPWPGYGK